jgi:hypothetical protein
MTGLDDAQKVKTLAEHGITKNQSSQWQQLADVPEEIFEAALKSEFEPITAARIIERHNPPPEPDLRATINRMDPQALWVCGRLRDFERERLFDADPKKLFKAMTDSMQADTVRLAPLVITFLSSLIEGASHE